MFTLFLEARILKTVYVMCKQKLELSELQYRRMQGCIHRVAKKIEFDNQLATVVHN